MACSADDTLRDDLLPQQRADKQEEREKCVETKSRGETDRVWAVYDVMGESVSQVVPKAPTLSHTQFLRVCLYMMTLDLGPWHMSEITPLHLRCISWGQDLAHISTHAPTE